MSKKIERLKSVTTVLTYIGRKLLYIMALHIASFFLCTKLIDIVGLGTDLNMSAMLYTYRTGANALLAAMYLLFGIGVPLLIMDTYDNAIELIIQHTQLILNHVTQTEDSSHRAVHGRTPWDS